ncbi:hypothetical protein DPEC_G00297320 [Dallia pectoralis]|uniref:Uncharacterized protein n=1 Tax=Dallia pectoralis TaxID=75939 RepID=A0ACC2FFK5_DALPE|nr:hypothetical protein DPEC_G00297320 [Dallia pectoralis]
MSEERKKSMQRREEGSTASNMSESGEDEDGSLVSKTSVSGYHDIKSKRPTQLKRPASHVPSCLSMKSDNSMIEPYQFADERPTQLKRPASHVPSCLSMKSDNSMIEPYQFADESGWLNLTEDQSRCLVCEQVLRDPVSINCGHRICRQCVTRCHQPSSGDYICPQCRKRSSNWEQPSSTGDYICPIKRSRSVLQQLSELSEDVRGSKNMDDSLDKTLENYKASLKRRHHQKVVGDCSLLSDAVERLYWRVVISADLCVVMSSALSSNPSHLILLDVSNNKLEDSGVKMISAGLENPHCKLETLRFSDCRITEEGCASLVSALKSNPSHLKELVLSKNDLKDTGVKQLSAMLKDPQCRLETLRLSECGISEEGCASLVSALKLLSAGLEDPHWRLKKLNLDHCGEWMLKSGLKKYVCDLTLDLNTVNRNVSLSEENRKVTWRSEVQPRSGSRWFQTGLGSPVAPEPFWGDLGVKPGLSGSGGRWPGAMRSPGLLQCFNYPTTRGPHRGLSGDCRGDGLGSPGAGAKASVSTWE